MVFLITLIDIHTVERLVPGPSRFEVEIAISKMKKFKSPGSELIQSGGEILQSPVYKTLIMFRIRRNCLRQYVSYSYTSRKLMIQ
jgi:hypothetical protein